MAPLQAPEREAHVEPPGKVEAIAAAIAGPAFAVSALLLREATLLPPALFDAMAAVLVAAGLSPSAHRRFGPVAATLLRGTGLTAGILLISSALVPPFDRAVVPLALWASGGTLLQAGSRTERGSWSAAVLGLAALAAGWAFAFVLAPRFPEPQRLRVVLLVAGPLALVGLALRALALRRGWRTLAPRPVGILLVIALGAIYLAYRGLVATRVDNLPLYEWTLGVAAASLLLTRLRRHAREHAAPDAWANDARRHAQDVAPSYDGRMASVAAVVQRYLDRGEGFDAYRQTMLRAAPHAPPVYERAVLDLKPAEGRAKGRAASEARIRMHQQLMELLTRERQREVSHGNSQPRLRAYP